MIHSLPDIQNACRASELKTASARSGTGHGNIQLECSCCLLYPAFVMRTKSTGRLPNLRQSLWLKAPGQGDA
jgi:hypothetical protein